MEAYSSFTACCMDDSLTNEDCWNLEYGNYEGIKFPIYFKHSYGSKKLLDILTTDGVFWLISEKMKNLLEENRITGWKTYPIKLFYKKMEPIEGYYGFSITGRCGPIDFSKSEIIKHTSTVYEEHVWVEGKGYQPVQLEKPYVYTWKEYKGLHIDLDSWDGSDFINPMIPEVRMTIVTQKVVNVLKGINRQITFTNLMDQRIRCTDAKGYKKKTENEDKEK